MPHSRRFRPRASDGRFVTTAGLTHHLTKHADPRLAFDPASTLAQFKAWQGRVRRKLRQLMGFPHVGEQPAPRRLWSRQRDGYELQKWEFYPEPASIVPLLVLVPDGVSSARPGPAVLCCPGSACTKELLAGEPEVGPHVAPNKHPVRNQMARFYAQQGIVAVAVDNPCIGELHDPICPNRQSVCWHLLWAGRTYEALSVFQKYGIVQWMKTLDFVDRRRIAASGHSLGAKPALMVGVLDPAVRAVVWNDFVSDWRVRQVVENLPDHPGWHIIPGFWQWFDYTDLMASLAPGPLLITEGGRTEDINHIRKAFRITDTPGNIKVTYYPKFATASKRKYDRRKLSEGLSAEMYFRYANVDVPNHCFKENVAVPWLRRVLSASGRTR